MFNNDNKVFCDDVPGQRW